jgi:hypothetical protein
MSGRDWAARLLGAACLGASWGSCLWLRTLMAGEPHDPTIGEAALVLASFLLTLTGLLLLLNGARMLRWPGPLPIERGGADPDALASVSLRDERAARADGLTRRAMRAHPQEVSLHGRLEEAILPSDRQLAVKIANRS